MSPRFRVANGRFFYGRQALQCYASGMPDLFAISCTTCKTRLRVRDASVVGQILACPKCSSMVLVEAPPGWAPPAVGTNGDSPQRPAQNTGGAPAHPSPPVPSAAPNSRSETGQSKPTPAVKKTAAVLHEDPALLKETAADSDFKEVDVLLGAEPPHKQQPVEARQAGSVAPRDAASTAARVGSRREVVPPPPGETHPDTGSRKGAPRIELLHLAEASSARLNRLRLLAMLAVAGTMGVALAIGAAVLASNWSAAGKARDVAVIDGSEQRPSEVEDTVESEAGDAAEAAAANLSSEPVEASQPAPEPESTSVAATEDQTTPSTASDDPLKLVEDPSANGERAGDDPLQLEELRKLSSLMPGNSGPEPDGTAGTEPAEESTPPVEPKEDAAVSRPRPEPRKVNLGARLADPILEIEIPDRPLKEVLQLLSNASLVPITIDPDALALSRITPDAPVRVKLQNSSMEQVLAEVLKPFRLEAAPINGQLVVTRSRAMRSIKLPVDDLTGGDAAKTQQLVAMIEALAVPTTWKSAGGEGTIVVEPGSLLVNNTELAYGQAMQVCERLRLARGSRLRNTAFPPEMFALVRRMERAAEKLDLPLTLNFGQPTPLVEILDRLGEETGLQILVDWRAAGEAGWPPDADATVTLDKTPLREGLVQLLGPMDLTYRVVDAKLLQVTTREVLEREPEIEVHPLGELAGSPDDAAELMERVSPSLSKSAVLRYDAPSKSIFALLPQPQQEELARMIDALRLEKTAAR